MARVLLDVEDPANRLTLRLMLEAEGHRVVSETPDVVLVDALRVKQAERHTCPKLVLASAQHLPDAVAALRGGARGIVHVPLLSGEAGLMVQRALAQTGPHEGLLLPPGLPLREVDARYMEDTLRRCKGNQAEAARMLDIGRNTLWRWLKKPDRSDPSDPSRKET